MLGTVIFSLIENVCFDDVGITILRLDGKYQLFLEVLIKTLKLYLQ